LSSLTVQHDHQLGGRDGQPWHAKVAAVVPAAGTLRTDTSEQFAGALAACWTIGAVGVVAPGPPVIDRIRVA
jgi:hypothetical protein